MFYVSLCILRFKWQLLRCLLDTTASFASFAADEKRHEMYSQAETKLASKPKIGHSRWVSGVFLVAETSMPTPFQMGSGRGRSLCLTDPP